MPPVRPPDPVANVTHVIVCDSEVHFIWSSESFGFHEDSQESSIELPFHQLNRSVAVVRISLLVLGFGLGSPDLAVQ